MKSFRLRNGILVAAISSAFVVGCGGGGGGTTPVALSTTGQAVDGYLGNAKVVLDTKDDLSFSGPSSPTDGSGHYSFSGDGQHAVKVIGGQDVSTGTPFLGVFQAPPASSVATPLTTLVMASLPPGQAITSAAVTTAQNAVKTALGISPSIDLTTVDPVAAVNTTTANISSTDASKLMRVNVAVQVLMQQAASVVAAASGLTAPTDIQRQALYDQAVQAVAAVAETNAAAGTPVDLASVPSFTDSVVSKTVSNAAASTAVQAALVNNPNAAAALKKLSPASVAAASSQTIANQVALVAKTSPTILAAAANSSTAANNPVLTAFTDTNLPTMVGSMSGLLTQTVATANPGIATALQATANQVQTALGAGAGDAAGVATAVNTLINQVEATSPSISIPQVNANDVTAIQTAATASIATAISNATTTTTAGGTTTTAGGTTTTAGGTTTTAGGTTTTAGGTTTTAGGTTTTAATTSTTATSTTTSTTTTTTSGGGSSNLTTYFGIANDTVTVEGGTCTLTQFATGCTATNPATASSKTIAFTLNPVGSLASAYNSTSFGLMVTGTGTDQRILDIGISPIEIHYSGGVTTLIVPGSAVLYVYGRNSAGTTTAVATLTNAVNQYVTIGTNNQFSLDYGKVLTTLTAGLNTLTGPAAVFQNLQNKTGTFNVTAVVGGGIPVASGSGVPLNNGSVTTNAGTGGVLTVTGPSISGKVTIN